jgi:hypothetical protein
MEGFMKKAFWSLLVFPSALFALDFNGEWKGCLAPAGHGIGRCILKVSIEQTAGTFAISERTYTCNGKKFTFQPVELDFGPEETSTAGVKVLPLLADGEPVGSLEVSGRKGQITKTPDGTAIKDFGFPDDKRPQISWAECFEASPGQSVCSRGSLFRTAP